MRKIKKVNTNKRKKERKKSQKTLQRRLNFILDLPEECCACKKAFDKKNKKMAQTWSVAVFESREVIRLTCPECWSKVKDMIEREVENENM